jgi:hypothetical protein
MATKRKSGGANDSKKALAGIEKAHKDLQLNIRNLKKALGTKHTQMGGRFTERGGRFTERGGKFSEKGGKFTERGGKFADVGTS